MKEFHLPGLSCRACGTVVDGATNMFGPEAPDDGSCSICMMCGEVSIYVVGPLGTALREPTLDELASLNRQPNFRELMHVYKQYRAENPEMFS